MWEREGEGGSDWKCGRADDASVAYGVFIATRRENKQSDIVTEHCEAH